MMKKNKILLAAGTVTLAAAMVFHLNMERTQSHNIPQLFRLNDVEALSGEWVERNMGENWEQDQSGVLSCGGIVKRWVSCKSSCNSQSCTMIVCEVDEFPAD
ncbi:MAG: hypothetical protein LBR10_08825 [Prevotellaceae bacterium]|jgi:hypothetical protein|nr:hypothetical protein [Prevotellaceae bacterium]